MHNNSYQGQHKKKNDAAKTTSTGEEDISLYQDMKNEWVVHLTQGGLLLHQIYTNSFPCDYNIQI